MTRPLLTALAIAYLIAWRLLDRASLHITELKRATRCAY